MAAFRFALLLVGILASAFAIAHGGGLDRYGCHNNRKEGGYHCHHGQFAGQSFESKEQMLKQAKKAPSTKAPPN